MSKRNQRLHSHSDALQWVQRYLRRARVLSARMHRTMMQRQPARSLERSWQRYKHNMQKL